MAYSARFQADVDRLLRLTEHHLGDGFTFISAGASDGVTSDPVYPLIERWGGSGVAVEPVPFLFDRLEQNYAHLPNVTCLPAAIAPSNGSIEIWYIEPGHGWLEYATQAAGTTSEDHLSYTIERFESLAARIPPDLPVHPSHLPVVLPAGAGGSPGDLRSHVRSTLVEALTFDDVADRGGLDQVDLVNLDIEGLDYEVFSTVDWERWQPKVLILETYEMTRHQVADVDRRLEDAGYRKEGTFALFSTIFVLEG